ncbi:hypothetical protein H0W91_03515 [Patescibacteria group bacterium]|nr:hypothetical protein [Patescibacteria group bacterium]
MIVNTWGEVLKLSFTRLWTGVILFIPNLIIALVIFCLGWAIGVLVGKGIEHLMKMIKFDEALRKAGFEDFVRRAGLNLNSGKFIGGLVKYFIIVVFLIASLSVLGLDQVTEFLREIVLGYVPQLIIAVLILLVGAVVGDVLSRIVTASARSANLSSANLLGVISKWAVWIFVILVAMTKMGIGAVLIDKLFSGVIVALSLAIGLAFGLGGQEAASKAIDRTRERISSHN